MIAIYRQRQLLICLAAVLLSAHRLAAFISPTKQYQYQVFDTSYAQKPSAILQSSSGDYLDRLSDDSFGRSSSSSSNGSSNDETVIEYNDFGDFFTPSNSISEQPEEGNSIESIDSTSSTEDNSSTDSFFKSLYKRQEQIAQSSRDLLEQWTSGMAKTTGAFTINEEFFSKQQFPGEYVYYDLLCLWDLLYLFVGSKLRCNIAVSFESFVHMIYSQIYYSPNSKSQPLRTH